MTWGEYLAWSLGNYRDGVERWEQVRKTVYTIARTMGGLESDETDFMPLPFDHLEQKDNISDEDLQEYIKQFRDAER